MKLLALALVAALPFGPSWDASAAAQEAGAETDVFVMGMTHSGHRTSRKWGLDHVEEAIRRLKPDVIVTEIPPDRFDAAMEGWKRDGRISEPRVARFPEYTDVVFPLLAELQFVIEPAAAWTASMNNLRRERIAAFETEAEHAEQFRAYTAEVAAIEARHAAQPLDDDDPFVIHSPAYDQRVEEELGPYDRYLNDWIGPGGWTNINRAHAELTLAAVQRHPGKRILVTFGAGHKYWLKRYLTEHGFKPMDITPYLPKTADLPGPARVEREVRELHRFFEQWFRAELPDTAEAYGRFADAMDESFVIVTPGGASLERAELLAGLRSAHGSHGESTGRYDIRVENVSAREVGEGTWLVRYEEWQEEGDEVKGRQSSAVLVEDSGAPGGFRWLHVHETWLL